MHRTRKKKELCGKRAEPE
jgi:hypothetical protein